MYETGGRRAAGSSTFIPASLTSDGQRKRSFFDNEGIAMKAAEKLLQRMHPETGQLAVK